MMINAAICMGARYGAFDIRQLGINRQNTAKQIVSMSQEREIYLKQCMKQTSWLHFMLDAWQNKTKGDKDLGCIVNYILNDSNGKPTGCTINLICFYFAN